MLVVGPTTLRAISKKRYAIRPGVGFADTTDFLFNECCKLAYQNLFPILGTPDKVRGQFVGDVFDVLCLHTHQYNMYSNLYEAPVRAALPLLES
jgi:hypothetical protein